MADFNKALPKTLDHEGFYSSHPSDKGAETYRGISRKFWPKWPGWPIVDKAKAANGGSLPWNYEIKDYAIRQLVKDFYRTWWNSLWLDKVDSQELAELIFDFSVNSGKAGAVGTIQRTLNSLGRNITVDYGMGPQTVGAINSTDTSTLYNSYKDARIAWFTRIVENDPSQEVFWDGWMKRINSFPDMLKKKAA